MISLTKASSSQQGAAVIMALFTVALVAGIATTLVSNLGVAMNYVEGRHDQAQAKQLARGALDWARNVLADDFQNNAEIDHFGEAWAVRVPPTPVEEGQMSGELQDMSGRFNLNSLVAAEGPNAKNAEIFVKLLGLNGVPQNEAQKLSSAVQQWLMKNKPTSTRLVDVKELLSIKGFTPEVVTRLSASVAALPTEENIINANTAPALVLAAAVQNLSIDLARQVVAERNRTWFKDASDLKTRLANHQLEIGSSTFGVMSRFFLATVRAKYGVSMIRMEVLLDRSPQLYGSAWPAIIWQKTL
ncbi:type II secretion system minor pseudopilin GspK [Methylophilus sp. 3sh_L]|uniref:type II secretion system minor pseudopilin GspK n=1 Tax=Methylophilus sp. 3sh_L TaxID=3377114 RepID=UPI00398F1A61